jgi:hypothetical protein
LARPILGPGMEMKKAAYPLALGSDCLCLSAPPVIASLNGLPQFLSGLEFDDIAGFDLEHFACLRIAAFSGFAP